VELYRSEAKRRKVMKAFTVFVSASSRNDEYVTFDPLLQYYTSLQIVVLRNKQHAWDETLDLLLTAVAEE